MTHGSTDTTPTCTDRAYIHDVGIKDSYFRGKSHVAGICGHLGNGRIENCWSAATVKAKEYVAGGIAGSCYTYASISSCYNVGVVLPCDGTDKRYGGICGSVYKSDIADYTLKNCVSLEGKCSVAYNLYDDDAVIDNVTIQNASAFADGTVCGLLKTHSAEFIDGYIPTSTTTGQYEHWHCALCGKNFIDEQCTEEATEANLTVPVAKNNEIWYTTTDNKKLTPYNTDGFGAPYNDANNVYEKGLGKITFDGNVTSIGNDAFNANQFCKTECARLQSIHLPSGVTSIGEYAFSECVSLSEVHIPSSVTSIEQYTFNKCSSMGQYIFRGCTNLNDVTIEDGAYIGEFVFQNYNGTLTINGSLSGVGRKAFLSCTVLTSVSVKSGSIGEHAFNGCTNLSTVTLYEGVTHIGDIAFNGCTNLSTVTLYEGVTHIGNTAFKSCSNLKDITVKWTEAEKIPSIKWDVFQYVDISKVTLHVPNYTTALYQAKDVWKDFKIVEEVNFIITKTDDTKVEQKVVDNGSVTIDESEGDIKSLVVSENLTNVSVTYIRNFVNAGKWQGWYVPFDVPVTDMTAAGLDVAQIYGVLLDKSGSAVIAFLKMEDGTVKANTPYVVRPKTSSDVTLSTRTTLYQTPTKPTSMFMMSIADKYTIGGIYEQTTTPEGWYAINKDGQFQKMGTGVNLRPFRIWMTIDPREDNPYAPTTSVNAKMNIMVIGDDEPTRINFVNENEDENENIYNLNGIRVKDGYKGIVIKNGKKVYQR